MNKIILAIIFTTVFHVQAIPRNIRGGFGHAYFGTAMNLSPDIQRDLRASALLGGDLSADLGYLMTPRENIMSLPYVGIGAKKWKERFYRKKMPLCLYCKPCGLWRWL